MIKLVEVTKLADNMVSYQTEVGEIDSNLTLQQRYEFYKDQVSGRGEIDTIHK
jgi:hypothetical protein